MNPNASYVQVGEMKGANQTELETQINLMLYTAYPRQYFIPVSICTSVIDLFFFGATGSTSAYQADFTKAQSLVAQSDFIPTSVQF